MSQILLASLFTPFIAAMVIAVWGGRNARLCRWTALVAAILASVGAIALATGAPVEERVGTGMISTQNADFVSVELPLSRNEQGLDVRFAVALDGMGLWLYVLTPILLITSVLVSWETIQERPALYYGMLLLLTGGCLGVFCARDIILFYIFFEFTLVPLFFLIGIWGSEERWFAAVKFFLYTLAGSVLTFLGLLAVVLWDYQNASSGTLQFGIHALTDSLQRNPMPESWQRWVFLALFAGFAIKVPLVPFHTWLPLAHVQAPTAGSVFLAGILLKIGTYGFLRFSLPMLPQASAEMMPWILWLAVIGIVYGAFVCLAQQDLKRLIAYSSVSHLGFCMLGLFALNSLGVQGAALQMVNHGISTGALFALVGMLYDRYHTRQIAQLGGLSRRLPWLSFFMVFFVLSSIGLPGLNGFAGEFLLLTGMFQRGFTQTTSDYSPTLQVIAILAVSGVVLGAWYMLWMVQKVFFGPLKEPVAQHAGDHQGAMRDLGYREIAALAPLAISVIMIGLYPKLFLDRMTPALRLATAAAATQTDRFLTPAENRAERKVIPQVMKELATRDK